MIEKLLKYKDKFQNILNSKSHAIIVESEDEKFLEDFSTVFALSMFCKEKICLRCETCNKILTKNCLDVITFNKALTVDDVESIVNSVNVVPAENDYKLYIINNFDEASERVQNKILKTLEEPPRFVRFLLLTKNINSILPTVLSRCEKYCLPVFDNVELLYLLEGGKAYSLPIIENCKGMYGIALNYSNNERFMETYELCYDLLKNMINSSKVLQYSSKIINNKDNILLLVGLIQNALLDVVNVNCGLEDLVKNKSKINDLKLLSTIYNNETCSQLIVDLDKIKEKLKFNANINLVVDKMLLNILEVKYRCKK